MFLAFYAQEFPTVELNTTGYRLPAEDQFHRWAEQVPDGFEFARLRWGFPPARKRGPMNFRSEGRRFPKGRCLVPTRTRSPKSKWKFTKAGEDWFCFAGLWRPMPDGGGDAFTLLTTEPGPDVAPIHDRQMIVLERRDWSGWLEQTGNEAELLRALPAGSLEIERVR